MRTLSNCGYGGAFSALSLETTEDEINYENRSGAEKDWVTYWSRWWLVPGGEAILFQGCWLPNHRGRLWRYRTFFPCQE